MRSRSERMSTLSATPVTAARAIGRSRRLIHVQIAAANAASPTIDHTIDPAIATDTPAIAVTAHHGAVADAHVTSPTDRMISTASGTVEPVGDASLSAAASPATAAVTSAPRCVDRMLAHQLVTPGDPSRCPAPSASDATAPVSVLLPVVGPANRDGGREERPGQAASGAGTSDHRATAARIRCAVRPGVDVIERYVNRTTIHPAAVSWASRIRSRSNVVRSSPWNAHPSHSRITGEPITWKSTSHPSITGWNVDGRKVVAVDEPRHRRFEGGVGRLGVDRPCIDRMAQRGDAAPTVAGMDRPAWPPRRGDGRASSPARGRPLR